MLAMGGFDRDFSENVKIQGWSLYAVGVAAVCLRIYASMSKLGWRNLRMDDLLMIPAVCLHTGLILVLNLICQGGGSIPYPLDADGPLNDDEIQERINGSKLVLVSEQCLLNLVYVLKTSMLILYARVTLGLATQFLVRLLAGYVALCWAASQVAFFSSCRPFSGYWASPPPARTCATLEVYEWVQGVCNITSDLLMLSVPIPLVLGVRMPWRQKAMLLVVFSMGVFVVTAALLTKIFDLSTDWDPTYMLWYIREASIAVLVANMPSIWPLLLKWCPCLTQPRSSGRKNDNPPPPPPPAKFGGGGGGRGGGGGGGGGRDITETQLSSILVVGCSQDPPNGDGSGRGSAAGSEIDLFSALRLPESTPATTEIENTPPKEASCHTSKLVDSAKCTGDSKFGTQKGPYSSN